MTLQERIRIAKGNGYYAHIEPFETALKLLAPYARKGVDSIPSPHGNDMAAHWLLMEIENTLSAGAKP